MHLLISDAPPLPRGGFGNFTIAWNLISALGSEIAAVVTHKYSRQIRRSDIERGLTVPCHLHGDFSWIPRLASFAPLLRYVLDALAGTFYLARHRSLGRDLGADRILALIGSEGAYLICAWAAGRLLRLPVDLYLVDDLEASALNRNRPISAMLYRWLEKTILPRVACVYVISEGYAGHLREKYGVPARVLPLPLPDQPVHYASPAKSSYRDVGFSGSLNNLYADALTALLEVFEEINATRPDRPFRLCLAGHPPPRSFTDSVPDPALVSYAGLLDRAQLQTWLAGHSANILPYAFDPSVRILVTTSFSSKLCEYLLAGRPILVFGPEASSTVRHFRSGDLPLVSSDREQLKTALRELGERDNPSLAEAYESFRLQYHSPEVLRRALHFP